jgi:hypothetical protein
MKGRNLEVISVSFLFACSMISVFRNLLLFLGSIFSLLHVIHLEGFL